MDHKNVVLVVRHDDEKQVVTELLEAMSMTVHHPHTGQEAIYLIEDQSVDFLIMDAQLPDMHAWKMLNTLKESVSVRDLPTIVIMDEQTVVPLPNVTPVVRPVSVARLKSIILTLMPQSDA